MRRSKNRNSARNRFVLWFSIVGVLIPVLLVVAGLLVGSKFHWEPSGLLGTALWILTWVIWPTWILMIDAEHAGQIIVMLLFAASLNGLWYGAVGLSIWYLGHGRNTHPKASPSGVLP